MVSLVSMAQPQRKMSSLWNEDENIKEIFDRKRKKDHKDVAARASDSRDYDYLRDHVGSILIDRL